MFRFFESRLPPYPAAEPHLPPKAFLAFVWDCTRGLRGYVAAMAGLSAAIAIYEALLFAVLGVVVDWISTSASPGTLWAERKAALIGITDLSRPDYGDAVPVHDDEIPVFWACGVTPQSVIAASRPEFCITHAPGHMLVTDLRNHQLAVL